MRFPYAFACFTSIASGASSHRPRHRSPASHTASSYSTSSNQIPGVSWRASYAIFFSTQLRTRPKHRLECREVVHPPAQRVDDLHHPSHRLRSIASDQLSQQRAPRFHLRAVSPQRLRTRRNSNPRNPKLAKSTTALGVPILRRSTAASHAADRRPRITHPPRHVFHIRVLPFRVALARSSIRSTSFRYTLLSKGEITPPCGTPFFPFAFRIFLATPARLRRSPCAPPFPATMPDVVKVAAGQRRSRASCYSR